MMHNVDVKKGLLERDVGVITNSTSNGSHKSRVTFSYLLIFKYVFRNRKLC